MKITTSKFADHLMVIENFSTYDPAVKLIKLLSRMDFFRIYYLYLLALDLVKMQPKEFSYNQGLLMQSILKLTPEEEEKVIKLLRKMTAKRWTWPTEEEVRQDISITRKLIEQECKGNRELKKLI